MVAASRTLPRMSRAVLAGLVVVFVILVWAPPANAAPITDCTGTTAGTTFTLTADCETTEPLTIPDGFTLDGAGHTISATDEAGPQWNGGIVTNAGPGGTMNIENVTITGPVDGFRLCTESGNVLYGIFFNDAGGSVDNVVVDHIYQVQNGAFCVLPDGPSHPGRRPERTTDGDDHRHHG